MKTHQRNVSAQFPLSKANPITPHSIDIRLRSYFKLPDFFHQIAHKSQSESEFHALFRKKFRFSQKFYQDSSHELRDQIERIYQQSLKPSIFSITLTNLLKTQGKNSCLFYEISRLLKLDSDEFEARLRLLLLKLRVIEEENIWLSWVCNVSMNAYKKTELLETLLQIKENLVMMDKNDRLFDDRMRLLDKGFRIKFHLELLEVLEKNPINKTFLEILSGSNWEKKVIDSIKSLKFDSHSDIELFEGLLVLAKRHEINEFCRKLINLLVMAENEGSSFQKEMIKFLKEFDLSDIERFLEDLLEIMRNFLGETEIEFQEKFHELILSLQSSGVLNTMNTEPVVMENEDDLRAYETIDGENDHIYNEGEGDTNSIIKGNSKHNFRNNPLDPPRNQTKADYDRIVAKTNKKYLDDLFLVGFSSLINNIKKPKYPEWKDIVWLRLQELFKSTIDTINLEDLSAITIKPQKFLQHKYLFTVFQAIKKKPKIIRNLLENQKINKKGAYFVKICQDGVWRYVVIDDFLPCIKEKDSISSAFIKVERNVWPLLIEKALAKIYHSFQSLELGNSIETLRDLTGAPFSRIPLNNSPTLFPLIKKFLELKFCILVRVACKYLNNKDLGFDPDYECHIINAYEDESPMIELEPPSAIDPACKSLISESYKGDRICLKWKEFLEYFDLLQVSKMHEDYYYITSAISHTSTAYSIRSFELTHPGHCYLEITQLDKRYFRSLPSYDYAFSRLILAKRANIYENLYQNLNIDNIKSSGDNKPNEGSIYADDGGNNQLESYVYIDGICDKARNLHLDLYLDEGIYYIIACLDYSHRAFDACLSYYGEEQVELDRESFKNNAAILEEIMSQVARKYGRKIELREGLFLFNYISIRDSIIIEDFVNENKMISYELKRNYKFKEKSISLIGEKAGSKDVGIRLNPKESETLLLKLGDVKNLEEIYCDLNEQYILDFKNIAEI